MTPLGQDFWKLPSDFLWTSLYMPFAFADFALCPFFVINHSYEYDYILSPVSPPNESSNPGVVLGTLDIIPYLDLDKTYKQTNKKWGGDEKSGKFELTVMILRN